MKETEKISPSDPLPMPVACDYMEVLHGLSPWAETSKTSPPYAGWWRVKMASTVYARRWWDGAVWSCAVYRWMDAQAVEIQQASKLGVWMSDRVIWCGLAVPHIAGYSYMLVRSPRTERKAKEAA